MNIPFIWCEWTNEIYDFPLWIIESDCDVSLTFLLFYIGIWTVYCEYSLDGVRYAFGCTLTSNEAVTFVSVWMDSLFEVWGSHFNEYLFFEVVELTRFVTSCDGSRDEFASLYRGWTVFRIDRRCILSMCVGLPRDAIVRLYYWIGAHSYNDWTIVSDSLWYGCLDYVCCFPRRHINCNAISIREGILFFTPFFDCSYTTLV